MKPGTKLRLKKEVLTELDATDLAGVVGGSHYCLTVPVNYCVSFQECPESHEATCLVPTYPNSCAC